MSAFTKEQLATLGSLLDNLRALVGLEIVQTHRLAQKWSAVLTRILIEKGVASAEDIDAAAKAVEADMAIDDALNPDLQAALTAMEDLLRKLRDEGTAG